MALRNRLINELNKYYFETASCIETVKNFLSRSSEWISRREAESEKLRRTKKKTRQGEAESGYKDEAELEKGLEETLKGLKEMQMFLDAVEKLAVTSRHVFEPNQIVQLSDEGAMVSLLMTLLVAHLNCPRLILFKRDNEAFFKPKLENTEVMHKQLNVYIIIIRHICDGFRKSLPDDLCLDDVVVSLKKDVSDDDIEKMLYKIMKLKQCRMDEDVRLLVLFQDKHELFMKKFGERKDTMLQYLTDVEACAVQLDDMNKGARISSVVGSSVGVVSGILSIVGLALIPVTLGASVALIGVGAGLGGLSGLNSIVTTATEAGVTYTQNNKANDAFQHFVQNVATLQNILNDVIKQPFLKIQEKADQAVLQGPLAVPIAASGGWVGLNAAFIAFAAFSTIYDSFVLSIGTETEISKCLRARAALWKSEIDSWQKMYESLETGLKDPEKIQFLFRELLIRESCMAYFNHPQLYS